MKIIYDSGYEVELDDETVCLTFEPNGDLSMVLPAFPQTGNSPPQLVAAGAVASYIAKDGVLSSLVDRMDSEIEHGLVGANADAAKVAN